MAAVAFDNASLVYQGADEPAVNQLNLEISDGEFLVLVGPSGSGKSTALRMIAGLEDVTSGTIRIGGQDVTSKAPKDRDIAMVFQSYALYPHMTVAANMGFSLSMKGIAKADIRTRVTEVAELLGLTEFLDRRPKALSGGQRQRVAMGRAIVREPQVFLMDEPLSNLDAKLRVQTRSQIAALQKRLGTTTVYVTHDQTEAMTMGHRVAVLEDGELRQVDTPRVLYTKPANIFVAGFIGSPAMNLRTVPVTGGVVNLGGVPIPLPTGAATGPTVTVGFRPEAVRLGADSGITLRVELTEELGADSYIYGTLVETDTDLLDQPSLDSPSERIVVRAPGSITPEIGDIITAHVDPTQLHLFDPATGQRL